MNIRFFPYFLLLFFLPFPAYAHPHVFVSVQSTIVFSKEGELTGIRYRWVFDDMYSAFATTGLKAGPEGFSKDQLTPIAKQNVEDLKPYQWFTKARLSGQNLAFTMPTQYEANWVDNKRFVLSFFLPLDKPHKIEKLLTLQVYDPTYFVAFTYEADHPPVLEDAPKGCSIAIFQPKPLEADNQKKKDESFFTGLPVGADFGALLAQRVSIACP